jgi:hypothetical protein
MKTSRILAPLAVAVAVAAAAPVAGATRIGNQGCSPGFWKNHTSAWQEYKPSDKVSSLFPGTPNPFGNETLLTALGGGGGSGYDGALKILLRAGTASFLNAASENVAYPYRRYAAPGSLYTQITGAIASHDRARMLALASWLDTANNLGCPS